MILWAIKIHLNMYNVLAFGFLPPVFSKIMLVFNLRETNHHFLKFEGIPITNGNLSSIRWAGVNC